MGPPLAPRGILRAALEGLVEAEEEAAGAAPLPVRQEGRWMSVC